jgi:hypothetical protein
MASDAVLTRGHPKPAGPQGCGRRRAPTPWARDSLRDVILGGQDGLVNILGILGVLAGGGRRTILLSTGLAAAITESISMGAFGYTLSANRSSSCAGARVPGELLD